MRTKSSSKKRKRKIVAAAFDEMFDRGEDLTRFLDVKKATAVRVKADFPKKKLHPETEWGPARGKEAW